MCWIPQSCIWEPSFLFLPRSVLPAAPPGTDYNEQLIRGGGSAAPTGSVINLHFIKRQTKEVEAAKEESSALGLFKSFVAMRAANGLGSNLKKLKYIFSQASNLQRKRF